MSPYVLDVLLWIIGIRGHIPHYDEFRPGRSESPPAANGGTLIWILATVAVSVALLAAVLWAVVWLAIKLL